MSFRGGRGNLGGFGLNNNAFSNISGNNGVEVEITGWNGASAQECINFISRKCKITVTNYTVNNATGGIRGFVRSPSEADQLTSWSGVRFAGGVLKMFKVNSNQQPGFGAQGGPDNTVQTLKMFLKLRYNPELKLLNLSAVQQDPTLSAKGFFSSVSTKSKVITAMIKVACEMKLDFTSADLSNNDLTDLTTVSDLAREFPKLQNLALLNNRLARVKVFEVWKKKLGYLRELILAGNPLLNTTNPTEINSIKSELLKVFPRLVILDGEVLRNEEALRKNLSLLFDRPQAMFFQDDETRALSTNFITNFYNLWDSNRQQLMVLYQNESQFSVQIDMSHPKAFDSKDLPDFSYYLPLSRNLTKMSSAKVRMGKLAHGQEQIFKSFTQIPKTQHDLITKPDDFSMECYRLPQMGAISITLHGSYKEVAPPENLEQMNNNHARNKYQPKKKVTLGTKGFDRTLIVIPGPNNSMIVASDLLCVHSDVGSDAFRPEQITQASPQPQNTPSPAPAVGTAATPSPGVPNTNTPTPPGVNVPTAADLPAQVKANLNVMQQELLVKVLLETKLNIEYGVLLCQQSNWDYQQCISNFKISASTLPPDAFAR